MNRHEKALEKLKSGAFIPANPLALTKDRQFDEEGQRLLTRYYLNAGSGGIAAAVHTTQFEIRLPKYHLFERVLQTAAEEIEAFEQAHDTVIIRVAGVCGELAQAVSEAQTAKALGYDAVLLSPGGLNHLTEEELLLRTEAVADVLPVIGFYLQTAVGGRQFSYSYWQRLCEIKRVAAIKCASFNRYTTLDVMRAAAFSSRGDELALYTGNDDNIVIDLLTRYSFTENGVTKTKEFSGGLLGHWSVWTKKAVELFEELKQAKQSGQISPALLTAAAQITDINGVFFDTAHNFRGCIAGLHEVLRRQGLMKGIWCLNPEETLSPGQLEEIDRVYAMYPQWSDDAFVREHLEEWRR